MGLTGTGHTGIGTVVLAEFDQGVRNSLESGVRSATYHNESSGDV